MQQNFGYIAAASSSLHRMQKSSLGSSYINSTVTVPVYTVLKGVSVSLQSPFVTVLLTGFLA